MDLNFCLSIAFEIVASIVFANWEYRSIGWLKSFKTGERKQKRKKWRDKLQRDIEKERITSDAMKGEYWRRERKKEKKEILVNLATLSFIFAMRIMLMLHVTIVIELLITLFWDQVVWLKYMYHYVLI